VRTGSGHRPDQIGPRGTADLVTEVSSGIDKWLWFVEAHLQAEL
jgi:starvation-inducible DNA-binding protein